MSSNALPDKLFFKIGEVAQIVGVRAHVLRYWESEFSVLRPLKTRGSHRVYRRRDVELAVLLRRLLHEEGLTIAGAKRRLRERGFLAVEASATRPPAPHELEHRSELRAMRDELAALLDALSDIVRGEVQIDDRPKRKESQGDGTASNSVPVPAWRRPVE